MWWRQAPLIPEVAHLLLYHTSSQELDSRQLPEQQKGPAELAFPSLPRWPGNWYPPRDNLALSPELASAPRSLLCLPWDPAFPRHTYPWPQWSSLPSSKFTNWLLSSLSLQEVGNPRLGSEQTAPFPFTASPKGSHATQWEKPGAEWIYSRRACEKSLLMGKTRNSSRGALRLVCKINCSTPAILKLQQHPD